MDLQAVLPTSKPFKPSVLVSHRPNALPDRTLKDSQQTITVGIDSGTVPKSRPIFQKIPENPDISRDKHPHLG